MDRSMLYRYTGNADQLYGVRKMKIAEGRAGGTTVLEVTTAGGLQFDVLPDTGLDLGSARYKGININYTSKNGYDSPASFLPYESEFNNTFPGGMMYTCGLRSVGPSNRDWGEWFPLHGRVHGLQAVQVCARVEDDAVIISGVLTESALFGHVLQLRRKITAPVYESRIIIEDTIENLTSRPEEYMLLYHFNFGYPFLSEQARLILPNRKSTQPRNADARAGLGRECQFSAPIDGEPEQVFFHEMGEGRAVVENPLLGISAALSWSTDTLPVFAQWKSMASGDYVLGLEPSNCFIKGREAERQNGTLKILNGFAEIRTRIELELSTISADN